jgi:hypothetical protein
MKIIIFFILFIYSLCIQYPYYCKPIDRSNTPCPHEDTGVCGHFSLNVLCITGPCMPYPYPNACKACKHKDVEFVTQEPCTNPYE